MTKAKASAPKRMTPAQALRAKWYATKLWQQVRRAQLSAHPLCAMCKGKAEVVDHIAGHGLESEWDKAFSNDEAMRIKKREFFRATFQTLCKRCHHRKRLSTGEMANSRHGFVSRRTEEARARLDQAQPTGCGGNGNKINDIEVNRVSATISRGAENGAGVPRNVPQGSRAAYINRILAKKEVQ